jgi:RNA polymerase sigma-70 factor (sigma-E family)
MTRRVAGAERDAEFEEFVVAQRGALVRMARLLTAGDPSLAEDLVQTTLTKLYVGWPRVRRAGNPVGYARTTLTHAFVDETRRPFRRRETTTDVVPEVTSTGPDDRPRDAVLDALGALPPRQRAVVVLRHWLDLDVAETARLLACSTGTVKSQNAKALDHLRAALAPTITPMTDQRS